MSRRAPNPLYLADLTLPIVGVAAFGGGWIVIVATWAGARAGAEYIGANPELGGPTLQAIIQAVLSGRLDPLIGPDGNQWLFWITLTVVLAVLLSPAALAGWWVWKRTRFGTPEASLARRHHLRDMSGAGARKRARQLRPSLADQPQLRRSDIGLRLGRVDGVDVVASEEDVIVEIAGPRAGKTSALVVPAILTAPGPCIVTSNKPDVYILTSALRQRAGRLFVLDPMSIVGHRQDWWIDLLRPARDVPGAQQLVAHFSATVGAGNARADPYFTAGAERLLVQLVVAAANFTDQGRSLRDVRRWLATHSDEPVMLLRDAGLADLAEALQSTLEAPADQRGGLYETAITALRTLESEQVARYVTPPHTWRTPPTDPDEVVEFDPWQLMVGHQTRDGRPSPTDTLYLHTREGPGSAAPVVAAITDQLLRTAAAAAAARGGRLDPPLRAVLDEAANICPVANLPDLYSYFGSMSIQVITILQSYQQGAKVWDRVGMDKLWSAATIKIIGAGIGDASFAREVSQLVNEHDVLTWSKQNGAGGHHSLTTSTRNEPIMSVGDIVELPKSHALMLAAGHRAALMQLMPWYDEPGQISGVITQHAAQASEQVRAAAIAELGPDNPLARELVAETHRHHHGLSEGPDEHKDHTALSRRQRLWRALQRRFGRRLAGRLAVAGPTAGDSRRRNRRGGPRPRGRKARIIPWAAQLRTDAGRAGPHRTRKRRR